MAAVAAHKGTLRTAAPHGLPARKGLQKIIEALVKHKQGGGVGHSRSCVSRGGLPELIRRQGWAALK